MKRKFKRIDRLVIAGSLAALLLCMGVIHMVTLYLRPYEQDTGPIPNAVTTGQWDHPPVEGSVIK